MLGNEKEYIQVQNMAGIILVADDDEDIEEELRLVLELEDYQVLVASNGLEALEVMRTNRPQLILLT